MSEAGSARPPLPTRGQWVLETSSSHAREQKSPGRVGTAKLTADVLLHPCESDTSFLAAFTESQQEGAWGLGAQDGSLPLLTDEAHYVPGATEEQRECMG